MRIEMNVLFLILFMAILTVLSGCNTQQASDLKTYNNPEFGFEFEYLQDWHVVSESRYQRAVCDIPEYRKTDLSCDADIPSMVLESGDGQLVGINTRQCLNMLELKGGNFICYDSALQDKGDSIYSGREKLELLSDEVRIGILQMEKTFKVTGGK